jgi:hypothetical protein
MRDVVVLGGYGSLGARVVRELVDTTQARIAVAGRSIQHAEGLAAGFGERARGAYADAADPRMLRKLLLDAALVIDCADGPDGSVLEAALELRVPFIGAATRAWDARGLARAAERAWQAQLPVIVHAGALPGLSGVVCDLLVRRCPDIESLRAASTGPWLGTQTAERAVARARAGYAVAEFYERAWVRPRQRTWRWDFPEPIGARALRPLPALDLVGFPEAHCVRSFVYLEPAPGLLERGLERVLGVAPPPGFALEAVARPRGAEAGAEQRVIVEAVDPLAAASAVIGVLARAILARRAPVGLCTPREAQNPAALLDAIEKRGVRVSSGS